MRNLDIFRKPITLSFKGHRHFSTPLGGLITLAILGTFAGFMLYKTVVMFEKSEKKTF